MKWTNFIDRFDIFLYVLLILYGVVMTLLFYRAFADTMEITYMLHNYYGLPENELVAFRECSCFTKARRECYYECANNVDDTYKVSRLFENVHLYNCTFLGDPIKVNDDRFFERYSKRFIKAKPVIITASEFVQQGIMSEDFANDREYDYYYQLMDIEEFKEFLNDVPDHCELMYAVGDYPMVYVCEHYYGRLS